MIRGCSVNRAVESVVVDMDVRWKQRFRNFSRAFNLLRMCFAEGDGSNLNQLEKEGAIKRFEYTWELAWNTIKDYLEYNGITIPPPAGPRNVIKEAARYFFEDAELDGKVFLRMLDTRNALSHMYDFEKFTIAISTIYTDFLPQLENLSLYLLGKEIE